MERVILTTGGTGGHIFPALAVAEELRLRFPDIDPLFVGSEYGPERALCERAGLAFAGLPVRGFWGRGLKALGAAAGMARGLAQAFSLLRRVQPEVVIGFGGYAAFAVMFAAKLLRIPTAVHEQNALAGVSNRVLGRFADKIFCSLPDTRGFGKRSILLTGNPVRRAVIEAGNNARRGEGKRLLIMGGSQGARALNALAVNALPRFRDAGLEILHQTGETTCETVRAAYAAAGVEARVEPFIRDMGAAYAWADLALCRSGATTLAELAACGLPAVFVPFPHATHNHQSRNAALVAARGAALVVEERDLGATDAPGLILELLENKERLNDMARAAKALARPEAAALVVEELEKLVTEHRHAH